MRTGNINRKTAETDITLTLCVDGSGIGEIDTGVGFLDHMLILFVKHSGFNLIVSCRGDVNVDDHHSVEDIGICLGSAFRDAMGDMCGIKRYGNIILPMDEALILTAVDISGRAGLVYDADVSCEKVGSFDTELAEEFMAAFVQHAGITLHIKKLAGTNSHHIIEGVFKSVARSLREATEIDDRFVDIIPSTKGIL